MRESGVERHIRIRAPIGRVFERLTDHEDMRRWPGVSDCRLITEGTPRNGLGAVRRISVYGLTLDEAVVRFDPPHRYDYSIVRGLPVDHLGTVELSAEGATTEVRWRVRLSSRIPLLAPVTARVLDRGLGPALTWFARDVESRDVAPAPAHTPHPVYRPAGISYVHLPSRSPATCAAFYQQVFGWKIRDGAQPAFEDGTGHVIGRFVTDRTPSTDAGPLLYIFVTDLDDTLARATAHGATITRPPYPEGDLWVAVLRDPDGSAIGAWQHGPRKVS